MHGALGTARSQRTHRLNTSIVCRCRVRTLHMSIVALAAGKSYKPSAVNHRVQRAVNCMHLHETRCAQVQFSARAYPHRTPTIQLVLAVHASGYTGHKPVAHSKVAARTGRQGM